MSSKQKWSYLLVVSRVIIQNACLFLGISILLRKREHSGTESKKEAIEPDLLLRLHSTV